ncbi:stalk domain-containing protein [Paenibacillus massiliensis]|uniref:stalk domain-containing protein n=1 Tax=Paenibacillus massiliensis TaxID=225917 RepID=UPI00046FD014|nr:stalk domain-containing protein [Paenibacillus massiliensis]
MKRLGSAFLSTLLLSSAVAGAVSAQTATTPIRVLINGVEQSYSQQPFKSNDLTLVPLRSIFEGLGAEVRYDAATDKITAVKGTDTLNLQKDSNLAYKNGETIRLDVPAQSVKGSTFVPLRFVSESLGAKVNWNASNSTIEITTETPTTPTTIVGSTLASDSLPTPATEATYETNTEPLELEDAVAMAIKSSNNLKTQEASLQQQSNSMEDAIDNLDFIPNPGGFSNDGVNAGYNAYTQQQIGYFSTQKQIEIAKDSLNYQVKSAYNAIITNLEAKRMADLNLEDAQRSLRIVQIKRTNDMASDFDVTQATAKVQQQEAAQEVALKTLDDSYRALNTLIGYKPDQKYALVDIPEFSVFESDVETKVSQVVTGSPVVWLQEQSVKVANLNVDYFVFTGKTANSFDNTKIEIEKAKLTSEDTKKQLADGVRSMYNKIKELETQYAQLQSGKVTAENALNVVKKRYDLGMATEYEVFQAQLQLESLKNQEVSIVIGLDNLKLAYEKPWAASGGASASASG